MEGDEEKTEDAAVEEVPDPVAEARREAARLLGAARTERKRASSAANGLKGGRPHHLRGGRPPTPLAQIPCTCGRGDTLDHPTTCPRGRAIRYRRQKGLPLE